VLLAQPGTGSPDARAVSITCTFVPASAAAANASAIVASRIYEWHFANNIKQATESLERKIRDLDK
jgi:hypothetical protein